MVCSPAKKSRGTFDPGKFGIPGVGGGATGAAMTSQSLPDDPAATNE